MTDIEIARKNDIKPIAEVAERFGIPEKYLELYGRYKAKLDDELYRSLEDKPDGKLVLVTAINPTPAGEGKTTMTIGLGQALNLSGRRCVLALREPSLGPCMGVKGGAAGGGFSQVVPMEDINLHFTGDIHAVTCAHNLLSAMIDNHIHHGNALGIDPRRVTWKRAMDMNDRALRNIVAGLGGKSHGVPREDGFVITSASEVMAVLCLCENLSDLKERLGRIVFGYSYSGQALRVSQLNAQGAMATLLRDALKPNLVQTLEHTPVIIHGGPFANIAHGCNSVRATKLALKLSDIAVTEAGFGADLGAEKFFNIKCRYAGLRPDAAVLVATLRALKYNGGLPKDALSLPNPEAVKKGLCNLGRHIENIAKFGVPVVVALNRFDTDTPEETALVRDYCLAAGAEFSVSEAHARGGAGSIELAEKLTALLDKNKAAFKPLYQTDMSIDDKLGTICREIYGADNVLFSDTARLQKKKLERDGFSTLPVCVAKTQYSLSDNSALPGSPRGFTMTVRELRLSAGAGFLVALTGEIMTMPGLPKEPAATAIDIDDNGNISGLF